jgi:hypothetical protein
LFAGELFPSFFSRRRLLTPPPFLPFPPLQYTGISTGWNWGYAPTSNGNLTIAKNLIHDIGKGVLSDMGGFYNLGPSPGTVVTGNVVHDVVTYNYGGWSLYLDEGSSNVVIRSCISFHSKSAGFHQHYGENNTIMNNIFAFPTIDNSGNTSDGSDTAAVRSSQHGPGGGPGMNSSFAFLRNIVLLDVGYSTLFYTTVSYGMKNMSLDNNTYWSLVVPPSTLQFPSTQAPTTFSEWQSEGKDGSSVVADPKFVDSEALDFSHLEESSPALALGFVPIDTSDVGPRSSTMFVGYANHIKTVAAARRAK